MTENKDEHDIVWGIAEMGEVINRTPRQTHWLIQTGRLPVRRFGRRLAARRDALLRLFEEEAE